MLTDPSEIVVFLGPSLPQREARSLLAATYLPPVQQGSLLSAALARPKAIVIIDGYFGWVPSVWHKEILWALAQRIPVYGASSMGALRAAELHSFGMIGFGTVFQDFVTGYLTDDDEVACVHADSEGGFRTLSDAMVNIRYTLAAARDAGVLSAESALRLTGHFKNKFFADRHLFSLHRESKDALPLSKLEKERFLTWLPGNKRDVKREDAVNLLRKLADHGPIQPSDSATRFDFQPTSNWVQLSQSVKARAVATITDHGQKDHGQAEDANEQTLVECRLAGMWPMVDALALAGLISANPQHHQPSLTEDELLQELARLCLRLGAADLDDLINWAERAGFDFSRLTSLVEREALLSRARSYWKTDLAEVAGDVLVSLGCRQQFLGRAIKKQEWLDSVGGRNALLDADSSEALAQFRARLGFGPESDEVLALSHGWTSVQDMLEDVTCDYFFRRSEHETLQAAPNAT